jgi:hypothetical protein
VPSRVARLARASTAGCSRCGEWPHLSTQLG